MRQSDAGNRKEQRYWSARNNQRPAVLYLYESVCQSSTLLEHRETRRSGETTTRRREKTQRNHTKGGEEREIIQRGGSKLYREKIFGKIGGKNERLWLKGL